MCDGESDARPDTEGEGDKLADLELEGFGDSDEDVLSEAPTEGELEVDKDTEEQWLAEDD